MQWYIVGRDMHVLCACSSDNHMTLPIDDSNDGQKIELISNVAIGTYDFTTTAYHNDSKYLSAGNYVVFKDKYNEYRMYTIMTIDGDSELSVHCEDIGLDLLNETVAAATFSGGTNAVNLINDRVLYDTGWSIGRNDAGTGRNIGSDIQVGVGDTTCLALLQKIMDQIGYEADFSVTMVGTMVTQMKVNIYSRIGSSRIKERFLDDFNLLSLSRKVSIENLATCVVMSDSGSFSMVNETYDDGDIYSPANDRHIYSRKANALWNRFRPYYMTSNPGTAYIVKHLNYSCNSNRALLDYGVRRLREICEPQVTYEMKLKDLNAGLGDQITITDQSRAEAIYLTARVTGVENHYSQEGLDTGTVSNVKQMQSNLANAIISEAKKNIVGIKGTEISYARNSSAVTPPSDTDTWSPDIPVQTIPDAMNDRNSFLWTRTVTTYTDGSKNTAYSVSKKGMDAVSLIIQSSNGTIFKNAKISTILTVRIIVGKTEITNSSEMTAMFDTVAHLQWKQKQNGDTDWTVLEAKDSRLSDNGFIFKIGVDDVNKKAVFACELIY